jgi:rhodanese-related sulfurtransferase
VLPRLHGKVAAVATLLESRLAGREVFVQVEPGVLDREVVLCKHPHRSPRVMRLLRRKGFGPRVLGRLTRPLVISVNDYC